MTTRFSGHKAYSHLQVLAEEIGPRHGSSRTEAKAASYIHGYFKDLGLDSRLDDYPIYSFEKADASLKAPDGRTFPCKPFPMTANTPARGVTGPAVFLEDAREVFLDERVAGSIVVTFNNFDRAAYDRLLKYKPAGVVSIQSGHSQLHVASPWGRAKEERLPRIPSVCMTYKDGLALIEQLPETLTLRSKTTGEGWRIGKNIIADLKGTDPGDDVIIVCAHYDSVWIGPGAFDNGGGAAAIMELARIYRDNGSKYNLRFCAFGGEEMGLWGSKGYACHLKERHDADEKAGRCSGTYRTELDRIRFVINLDMMGMYHGRSNAKVLGHPDIAASVRLLANRQRYAIDIEEDKIYSSDNRLFNFLGIPSLSFNRVGYANGNGHTAGDTIDNCSPEGLAHIGAFVERWIDHNIMELHSFPFPRKVSGPAKSAVDKALNGKDPFQDYSRRKLLQKAKKAK